MRPIKFRVWDKEDAQMRDVLAVNFYHRVLSVEYEGDQFVQDGMNRFILMQYTGLKDKNGVDIYEGDVVELNVPTYKITTKTIGDLYDAFILDNNVESISHIEVIGNIYEDSDLIK